MAVQGGVSCRIGYRAREAAFRLDKRCDAVVGSRRSFWVVSRTDRNAGLGGDSFRSAVGCDTMSGIGWWRGPLKFLRTCMMFSLVMFLDVGRSRMFRIRVPVSRI